MAEEQSFALTELAMLVGALRRWTETHPDDQEAPVVLARATVEWETRVKPWREAMDEMGIILHQRELNEPMAPLLKEATDG